MFADARRRLRLGLSSLYAGLSSLCAVPNSYSSFLVSSFLVRRLLNSEPHHRKPPRVWGIRPGGLDYYPLVPLARRGMVEQSPLTQVQDVHHSIERRISRRFQIVLPVLFRWADSIEHYDVGHCANIGHGGMFILAARCPPTEAEVAVEFALPPFEVVRHSVSLRCIGRVTRVETCYQLNGFAVDGHFVNEAIEEPFFTKSAIAT